MIGRRASAAALAWARAFALTLVVASCAAPTPTALPSALPSAIPSNPTDRPASVPPATTTPSRLPTGGGPVPIDVDLLDALPAEVDELAVVRTDEALADALADPGLVRFAEAVAAAIAVDPASGEFAYATVVRPLAVPPTDEALLDWRDSFDEGVCAQAGGVSGTAEADIGRRPVFIGSCAGGVRTYHAWLGNRGVLVSVSSVGERRLGEQLVEGLRD